MQDINTRNPDNSTGLENPALPLFSFERDFLPVVDEASQNKAFGPVDNFTIEDKTELKNRAVEMGKIQELLDSFAELESPDQTLQLASATHEIYRHAAIENGEFVGPFQHCAPFSNPYQKKLRQEILRVKNISTIFNEVLSGDIDNLNLEEQALRLYLDRVVNQSVLVEASRRSYLAMTGQGTDDPEFCKGIIQNSLEELYPSPSQDRAKECLGLFIPKIEKLNSSQPGTQNYEFAKDILRRYPFLAAEETKLPEALRKDRQAELGQYLRARYQPAFDKLKEEFPEISNAIVPQMAQRFLEHVGYAAEGWECQYVGKKRTGFYTDPANRVLESGDRSKELAWPAFERLMIHEVGVHVARAVSASKKGVRILELGLSGYEDSEEGLAILLEKVWAETASKKGVIDRDHYRYLIGSFAAGALDGNQHSPQESFDFGVALNISSKMARSINAGNQLDMQQATKEARSSVFEHVYRFYRGMPEGCVMLKDLVYFDGWDKIVRLFNDSPKPTDELVNELLSGKYDPFDQRHVKIKDALYGKAA